MQHLNRMATRLFLLLTCCLSAQAQTAATREAEFATKQSVEFGARGVIQLVDSFGAVSVEGWDKQEVELSLIRRTKQKYAPQDLAKAAQELERVRVKMELVQESALLVINTVYASRGKGNLKLEYLVKVPRRSSLQIKHGDGELKITNSAGDIEATARHGGIHLSLPENQTYTVDARARVGDVSSEFGYVTWRRGLFSVGSKLIDKPAAPTNRLYLRVGVGVIHIHKLRAGKSGEQTKKKATQ